MPVDVLRERLEFPELRRRIISHKERFKADLVLIEDRGSGIQLIQDLKYQDDFRPVAMDPKEDKATRLMMHTPRIEAGQIILPKSAPWLDDFLTEILQFPQSRHDDQVDSLSQFLAWAANPTHRFFVI